MFFINSIIEKCSESIGIIFVLFFTEKFLIKFHPQIIASLLAKSNFLVNLINAKVGTKPAIPGIAEIEMSDLRILF